MFEVIVGNVGTVYTGEDCGTAMELFLSYQQESKKGYGRASGESVTLMQDGEIMYEHAGTAGK